MDFNSKIILNEKSDDLEEKNDYFMKLICYFFICFRVTLSFYFFNNNKIIQNLWFKGFIEISFPKLTV